MMATWALMYIVKLFFLYLHTLWLKTQTINNAFHEAKSSISIPGVPLYCV